VAYSIQAIGPHGPGYQLAGSVVSCRQLEADAGTVDSDGRWIGLEWLENLPRGSEWGW